ncbi:hypothetical protein GCM10023212_14470 [Luteolibacter yonseiensis]
MLAIGFIHSNLAAAEEISVAGYLDKRISVEFSEKSLTRAVHAVMDKMRADDLDVLRLNFEFKNSSKFDEHREITMKLENMRFSEVLYHVGTAFKHGVNYDFRRNTIIFTAAGGGEDDVRRYRITEAVSARLGLNWASEAELEKSLDKYGVKAALVKTNPAERTFTASGMPDSLDHIDMLIYVFSRMPE